MSKSFACVVVVCGVLGMSLLCHRISGFGSNPASLGIYAHTSGQAALVAGESCVINDNPEVSDKQVLEMASWCVANRHN